MWKLYVFFILGSSGNCVRKTALSPWLRDWIRNHWWGGCIHLTPLMSAKTHRQKWVKKSTAWSKIGWNQKDQTIPGRVSFEFIFYSYLHQISYIIFPPPIAVYRIRFKHFSEILHRRGDELGQCRCSILLYGLLPWWTFCNRWLSWPIFRREWDRNANSFIVCI